jgi:hypothetical protein
VLTRAQQRDYDRNGFLVLRGAISGAACRRMVDRLWEALAERHGIRRDAPETWAPATPRGLQKACRADAFVEIASSDFRGAVDDLIGEGTWDPPRHWGGPLVTFPTPEPWDVPARMWHLDYPVRGRHGARFAVKALCLLDRLEPRGGGTLLLEGSHHLMTRVAAAAAPGDAGHSGDVLRRLARKHAWLARLVSRTDGPHRPARFMDRGSEIDGVRLRVVEFTGNAGDVVFFHPWVLHNASPNCRTTPRLMVGQNLTTRTGLAIYARAASE